MLDEIGGARFVDQQAVIRCGHIGLLVGAGHDVAEAGVVDGVRAEHHVLRRGVQDDERAAVATDVLIGTRVDGLGVEQAAVG